MHYWLKIVFVDSTELNLEDTQKHFVSDDLEVLEVTTAQQLLVIPMKQIKYVACDAKIFQQAAGK